MTHCTLKTFQFPSVKKLDVTAQFSGGSVTSDAGGLLLREADRKLNLLAPIAKLIPDKRDQNKIDHSMLSILKQRVFGIALGYEDLNDHATLRHDLAFQTFVNTDSELASPSTLCRFENQANRKLAWDIHKQMVENFIASFEKAPKELILDFDATDDLVHGKQEGSFFNGYYDNYCFLPLYVFCGQKLLVAYLRQSNEDGALHAWAILSILVKRLRQAWPHVKITFRGDSGFCRHDMLTWCEKNKVFYIVGIAQNSILKNLLQPLMIEAKTNFEDTKIKQKLFTEFTYGAGSWSGIKRRIIGKVEHTEKGENQRFIVTNIQGGNAKDIYEVDYCGRGDMENRIKEVQLGLYSDRTSCHRWWSNQLRMLLSALAFILMEYIRTHGLEATELANAQVGTIRLKLFKIGAIVLKNTRRIQFLLSSHFPLQDIFASVYAKLVPT